MRYAPLRGVRVPERKAALLAAAALPEYRVVHEVEAHDRPPFRDGPVRASKFTQNQGAVQGIWRDHPAASHPSKCHRTDA